MTAVLRRGERLCLRWEDVDLEAGLIPVRMEMTSPAVSGGLLCGASQSDGLYAVDADTGREAWRFGDEESRDSWISTSPAIADGIVFFGTEDGLYALK